MADKTAGATKLDYDRAYEGAPKRCFDAYCNLTARLFDPAKSTVAKPDIDAVKLAITLDLIDVQIGVTRKFKRVLQISYMNNGDENRTKQDWSGTDISPGRTLFNAVLAEGANQSKSPTAFSMWLEKLLASSMEAESYAPPPWTGPPPTSLVWSGSGDSSGTPAKALLSLVLFNMGGGTPEQMGLAVSVFLHALRNPSPVWNAAVESCVKEMQRRYKDPGNPKSLTEAKTFLQDNLFQCLFALQNEGGALDVALTKRASLTDAELTSLGKDFVSCYLGLMCSGFVGNAARHFMRPPVATCVDEIVFPTQSAVVVTVLGLPDHTIVLDRWNRGSGNDCDTFGHAEITHQLPRLKASEVRAGDPLTHHGHVMILDAVSAPTGNVVARTVYESTGDPGAGGLCEAGGALTVTGGGAGTIARRTYVDPGRAIECFRMDHFRCPWHAKEKRGFLILEWGIDSIKGVWGGQKGSDTLPAPPPSLFKF